MNSKKKTPKLKTYAVNAANGVYLINAATGPSARRFVLDMIEKGSDVALATGKQIYEAGRAGSLVLGPDLDGDENQQEIELAGGAVLDESDAGAGANALQGA